MEMSYQLVTMEFTKDQQDLSEHLVKTAMQTYHCSGVEEYSLEQEWIDRFLGQRVLVEWEIPPEVYGQVEEAWGKSNNGILKFYFSGTDAADNAKNFISLIKEQYPFLKYFCQQEKELDWNSEWKKNFHPIAISSRLTIVPAWMVGDGQEYNNPIYINPGTGFGTGNHETTYMCLQIIDDLTMGGQTWSDCLDFGCGSGILGIAAGSLGIPEVIFCDIDPMALENCQENIDLNIAHMKSQYSLRLRSLLPERKYDLIMANILLSALKSEANLILQSLNPGGHLLVSGIFHDQLEELREYFNQRTPLKQMKQLQRGEWTAVLWKKDNL